MELLSPGHLIPLVIIAGFVFFGWKQLPDMSRSVGRSLHIFKNEMSPAAPPAAAAVPVVSAVPAASVVPAAAAVPVASPETTTAPVAPGPALPREQ
jgi:sec-independent protein translocase protein TatA